MYSHAIQGWHVICVFSVDVLSEPQAIVKPAVQSQKHVYLTPDGLHLTPFRLSWTCQA